MVCQMQVEMQVALNFILSYLYNKLPRTRVHLYGEELEIAIRKKFESHWYPTTPNKGSAYRCIHVNPSEIDPAFEVAAARSGLDFHSDIKPHLPSPLSVWVDPGEVSYQISSKDGKGGAVKILYKKLSNAGAVAPQPSHALPNVQQSRNQFGFNPNAKDFTPKSTINKVITPTGQSEFFTNAEFRAMGFNNRPQRRLYTVDEFASTKFGSTKMKNCVNFQEANLTPSNRNPAKPSLGQGLPNTTSGVRPQSLGFPTWDQNQSPEFQEFEFSSYNVNFGYQGQSSSFDSPSSSPSSIDNLNSPTKQTPDGAGITQWSSGNDLLDDNNQRCEYYQQNSRFSPTSAADTWNSGNQNIFNEYSNFSDSGGISCQ